MARSQPQRVAVRATAALIAAILAVLVGGVARAEAVSQHSAQAATLVAAMPDAGSHALRVDGPAVLVAAAMLVVGLVLVRRRRPDSAIVKPFTASTHSARGPPRQAL